MTRTIDGSIQDGELSGGTAGQVPYQSAPDTTDFTGPGTAGQVLMSTGGSAPTFQTLPSSANIPGGTAGQVVYQSAPSTTTFTGPGTSGQVLTSTGGTAPTFQTLTTVPSANNITGGSAGLVLYQSAPGVTSGAGPGTAGQVLTSNGAAAPTYQNVSLATNASNLSSGTAGQVPYQIAPGSTGFAGPGSAGQYLTSNGTGAPTYTTLVTAPTANSIAAGAANQVLYQSASSTTAFAGPGTSGQILTANGSGVPTFQTLTVVPRATNISGGTVGQLPYQSAVDTTDFVGPGTAGQVLTSNGAAPPSFQTPAASSTQPTYTVFTAGVSGTYNSPLGCTYMIVEMIGGGGGGGLNNVPSTCGGGGASASYLKLRIGAGGYTYTVGGGGAAAISGGAFPADGTAGTATGFGLASSFGGGGGSGTGSPGIPGASNTGGYTVLAFVAGVNGAGGAAGTGISSPGGSSFWGNPKPGVTSAQAASVSYGTATGYGTGGTGLTTSFPPSSVSENGAPGRLVITEFY